MSPPLLGVGDEEGKQNVSLLTSSASTENGCLKGTALKERNYMGLSDCSSSEDSSVVSIVSAESKKNLNFKATELRLGLPGSLSPERETDLSLRSSTQLGEKPLFPLRPSNDDHYLPPPKTAVLGSKRGFSDAMNGFPEGDFLVHPELNVILSARPASNFAERKSCSVLENIKAQPTNATEGSPTKALHERVRISNETRGNQNGPANNTSNAPASKAQVVGWPPIGSFRKNSLATKTADEVDGKAGANALFVKVSMDGAPYLRKVDLTSYSGYPELSSALEKMFSCFTIALGRETLCESKLKDLLHGSEYVLTYEDKDGDWMLVGDVPWEMFIDTCRRMRIMKSSDAIGLAPRAVEKSKTRT